MVQLADTSVDGLDCVFPHLSNVVSAVGFNAVQRHQVSGQHLVQIQVFLVFFQPISFRTVSQIIDMVKKNKMYVTCFCSFTQNIGFLIDDWYTMGLPWKTFCALIEWIQLPYII